jgi:hypothetical protein
MMNEPDDIFYAAVEIGHKNHLTPEVAVKSATGVLSLNARYPDTHMAIVIGGYDNDDRELWDIPEAAEFVKLFATLLCVRGRKLDSFNFVDDSLAVLALCTKSGKITQKHEHGYTVEIEGVGPRKTS